MAMETRVSVPRIAMERQINRYKKINLHLVGGQTMQRMIGKAAGFAAGTVAFIALLDQASPFAGTAPDLANAIKAGLLPGIGLGGIYFGVQAFLQRASALRSGFVAAIRGDGKDGLYNSAASAVTGLPRTEDKDILFHQISTFVSPQVRDAVESVEKDRNTQITSLITEIKRLNKEADVIHANMAKTEAEFGAKKRELTKQVGDLSRQIETNNDLLRKMDIDKKDMETNLHNLSEQLRTAQQDYETEKGRYEQEKMNVDGLLQADKDKLEQGKKTINADALLQAEREKLEQGKRVIMEGFENLKAQHQVEIDGLIGRTNELQGKVQELTSNRDALALEQKTLENQVLPKLNEQLKTWEKAKEERVEECAKEEEKLQALRKKSMDVMNEISTDKTERDKIKFDIKEARKELDHLLGEVRRAAGRVTKHRGEGG